MKRRLVVAAVALLALTRPASAQVLLDVGGVFVGGATAGSSTATYTTPDGTAVPLFSLEKSIGPGGGVTGHLAYRFTPRVALELNARWVRAPFRTKLGDDADGADDATATQSVDRFVVGAGAVVNLKQAGRWRPFARVSAGWLREVSDDLSLYEDGWAGEIGAGVNYLWKEKRGRFRPYGIRMDVWLDVRQGGLSFTEKSRLWSPAISVAMIFKL